MMPNFNSVLVTGGGGYVGSTLVKNLVNRGYRVRAIDSMFFGKERLEELTKDKSIEFMCGDIRDYKILENSLDGIDCVFHLAAVTGPLCERAPKATKQINVDATTKLIKLCKKKKVKRFFFSSTCSNYGSNLEIVNESTPLMSLSLYSETKIISEASVINSKDPYFEPCILRFATVFGTSPKMRFDLLVHELIREAIINKKIRLFGPQYWRPIVHVEDVSKACILGMESPLELISGEIYNVGDTEQNYRKINLAELVQEFIPGIKIEVEESKKDPRNYRVSFEKIKTNLGFSVEKTVKKEISEMVNKIKKGIIDPTNSDSLVRSKLAEKIRVFKN